MRIDSTRPLTSFSELFSLKRLPPSPLRDSIAQAPATERQTCFPLAYWRQGPFEIFVSFDLQKEVVAKVYQNGSPLTLPVHFHPPLRITHANLRHAQQTLSQMSLNTHYEERTLHLTPQLRLCGGMPQKEEEKTTKTLSGHCDDKAHTDLAHACIQAFKTGLQRPQDIAELAELARSKEVAGRVVPALLRPLKKKTLLDPMLLQGLARALEYADSKSLSHADLVAILAYLEKRIAQLSSTDERRLIQEFTALSSLLDAMVAADVRGLDREQIHEAVMKTISSFTKHECEEVVLLAQSCEQALIRLPSDESKMHSYLRRALALGEGVSLLAEAWGQKDIRSAVSAFHEFYKAFKPKKGKKQWYESVQFAKLLIRQGHYREANEVLTAIPEKYRYCIHISISALPKQERSLAKKALSPLPPCSLCALPKAGVALIHKAHTTLPWRLHTLKQERLAISEEEKLYIPLDGRDDPHSKQRLDLLKEAYAFFASNQTVLLIQGGSGAGKSTFLRLLERECWEREGILPLHIRLGKIDPKSPHIIEDALSSLHFNQEQIADLKKNRLVIFLDGYDEMRQGQLVNLYEHGGMKEWNAQVVISCRSQHLANRDSWQHYFAPFKGEQPDLTSLRTLYVAPFSDAQVSRYLDSYLKANPTPEWTTKRFMEMIEQIKGLKELIEAPFILRITAEVLPTIVKDELPKDLTLTRRTLYDAFADLWFERQEKKLRVSGQEVPQDFKKECLRYCQNLAAAMMKEHVVEVSYDPIELFVQNAAPSKWEPFLGPTVSHLRAAALLTKTEGGYAFIHKSVFEHFASKATAMQLSELSQPKHASADKQIREARPTRSQEERYTTFDIESTRDLAKKWEGTLSDEEQDTLYNLAIETLDALSLYPLTEEVLEEMIPLASIPSKDLVRRLLEQLIHPLKEEVMVDLNLVRSLSRAVARVDTTRIAPSDLTTCVDVLQTRLTAVHKHQSEPALFAHLRALEQLTTALLDTHVVADDAQVKALLEALKGIPSQNLQILAARNSLKQALLRLKTDQDRLSDWLQRGAFIATGISALIESAGSYSPRKAVEGLVAFKKACETKGKKHDWYDEVRIAQLVIAGDDTSAYQKMQLKPSDSHVQLALIMELDRGVRTTEDEGVRAAWIEEIISLGASNQKIQGSVNALVKSYGIYDAPEVRCACAKANFPHSSEVWMNIHTPRSYGENTLLTAGKRALSWRLAQLKTVALNDPTVLQERAFHVPVNAAHNASSSDHFPLEKGVRTFLESDKQALLLLGGSGSGKSLSMKMLTADLWHERAEGGRIPLFLSLTGVARTSTTIVEEAFKKEGFTEEQIAHLKDNYDFIFILDGYDEMSGREVRNLLTTNNLSSWRAKVIITCRTQYALQALGNYKEHFMPYDSEGSVQTALYEEIITVPFNAQQINSYLQQFCTSADVNWTPAIYQRYIERIPNALEMIENPFVLRILAEVLPGIIDKRGADDAESLKLTRIDFYEAFMRDWFDRQHDKLIRGGWGALSPSETKGYSTYAVKLATRMLTEGMSEVRYAPSKQEDNPFAPFFATEPPLLVRARTACPLIIFREGEEIIYRFLHKSLLEFLGGRSTCDEAALSTEELTEEISAPEEIDVDEPQHSVVERIIASPLNQRLYTQEMGTLRFWVDDVKQNRIFRDQLLTIIELSKQHPQVEIAAANAITILVGAEHPFNGADLREIRIRGALIDRGNFSHADLRGADLRGCSLHETFLVGANCEGAHLEKTDWGPQLILMHTKVISDMTYSPTGTKIVTGSDDGVVRVWDAQRGSELFTFTKNTSRVDSVKFSPDGKQIAVKYYGIVNIFDADDGSYLFDFELPASGGSILYSPDGTKIAISGPRNTVRVLNAQNGVHLFTLEGHRSMIRAIRFSPDGTKIATGSEDKTICVWNAVSGSELFTLKGHLSWVFSLAFSPGGKEIASGSEDNSVSLWYAQEGSQPFFLCGHTKAVYAVTYSPDGRQIASESNDGTVRIWTADKGEHLFTLTGKAAKYSPDGTKIATIRDQKACIWDGRDGSELFTITGCMGSPVIDVRFSPDGRQIATTSGSSVQIHSSMDKLFLAPRSSEHRGEILSLACSPDGKQVVSGSKDKTVCIWNTHNGSLHSTLIGHTDDVNAVAYSPNEKQIGSGSKDKTVRIWNTDSGSLRFILSGHTDRVNVVAYNPNGTQIASGSSDNTVRIWNPHEGIPLFTLRSYPLSRQSVFSPDGEHIASIGHSGTTLHVWNAQIGLEHFTFTRCDKQITDLAFSPDGNKIVMGSSDKTVRVLDVNNGAERFNFTGHTDMVNVVAYSPNGEQIASGSSDKTVRIWNIHDASHAFTLLGHEGAILALAYHPSGTQIASGSFDKTVRIWNTHNGSLLFTLLGHEGKISAVVYSPNGKQLASGSSDRTVQVWDPEKGQKRFTLSGHEEKITALAFSPHGTKIATGSWDKTVRVWKAETGEALLTLITIDAGRQINALAFSADESLIMGGDQVWDAATGSSLQNLAGRDGLAAVAFSPDRAKIAVYMNYRQAVRIYDVNTKSALFNLGSLRSLHSNKMAFSPDGTKITAGSFWDTQNGKLLPSSPKLGYQSFMAYSPDGTKIAMESQNRTGYMVHVWDAEVKSELCTLAGHEKRITAGAFNPKGTNIATGSYDQTVCVWNVEDGSKRFTLLGHKDVIKGVAYNSTGTRIATSCSKMVQVWDATKGTALSTYTGTTFIKAMVYTPDERIVTAEGRSLKAWSISADGKESLAWRTGKSLNIQTLNIDNASIEEGKSALFAHLGAVGAPHSIEAKTQDLSADQENALSTEESSDQRSICSEDSDQESTASTEEGSDNQSKVSIEDPEGFDQKSTASTEEGSDNQSKVSIEDPEGFDQKSTASTEEGSDNQSKVSIEDPEGFDQKSTASTEEGSDNQSKVSIEDPEGFDQKSTASTEEGSDNQSKVSIEDLKGFDISEEEDSDDATKRNKLCRCCTIV